MNGDAVIVDWESPDRIAARNEPLHIDDEDFDNDFAPDDGGETVDMTGIKGIPRDALKTLLRFLLPANSRSVQKRWRIGQLRLAAISHLINLDGIGGMSLQDLGVQLNCTRSLLSLYQIRIIDSLGIQETRNGKSKIARESYREAATESHRRRGHRMKPQDASQVA